MKTELFSFLLLLFLFFLV